MSDPTKYHPFTNLVDMSPDAIARRIKEVFDMNRVCAWLREARPAEAEGRVAEQPKQYPESGGASPANAETRDRPDSN